MLDEIFDYLEQIKFPKTLRKNISKDKISGFTLGDVRYRRYINGSLIGKSIHTKKHPILFDKLNNLIKDIDSQFEYTTIQINKNILCPAHIDKNNIGLSYIIGLGNYEHGELVIENIPYDIKKKWLLFDGKKVHWTNEFQGDRYTIIYYKHNFN